MPLGHGESLRVGLPAQADDVHLNQEPSRGATCFEEKLGRPDQVRPKVGHGQLVQEDATPADQARRIDRPAENLQIRIVDEIGLVLFAAQDVLDHLRAAQLPRVQTAAPSAKA